MRKKNAKEEPILGYTYLRDVYKEYNATEVKGFLKRVPHYGKGVYKGIAYAITKYKDEITLKDKFVGTSIKLGAILTYEAVAKSSSLQLAFFDTPKKAIKGVEESIELVGLDRFMDKLRTEHKRLHKIKTVELITKFKIL